MNRTAFPRHCGVLLLALWPLVTAASSAREPVQDSVSSSGQPAPGWIGCLGREEGGRRLRRLVDIERLFGIQVASSSGVPELGLHWYQRFPRPSLPGGLEFREWLGTSILDGRRERDQCFRLSFVPSEVRARDFEDLFLAGHPWVEGRVDEGRLVIERWSLHYPEGSLVARRPKSSRPLGTAQDYQRCVAHVEGERFLPVDEAGEIVETRSLLHCGEEFASMTAMAVDPEGRFILLALGDGTLRRVSLPDFDDVAVIGSVEDSAGLHGCQHLAIGQHAVHGRICVASRGALSAPNPDGAGMHGEQARSVFIDAENDGDFERTLEIPDGSWTSSALWTRADWIDGIDDQVDARFEDRSAARW